MVRTKQIINHQFVLNWKHIISIFLLSRLIIGILYIFIAKFTNIGLLDGSTYCTFDCNWYLSIIKHGYTLIPVIVDQSTLNQSNLAFFPLMPLIIKLIIYPFTLIFSMRQVGVIAVVFGIIMNNLLLLGSLYLLKIYFTNKIDSIRLTFLLILVSLSPLNIYINSLYPESLYLFLSLVLVVLIENRKYFLESLVMSLVSICKPQGVFFIPVFMFLMLTSTAVKPSRKPMYLLLSLIPITLYFAYIYALTKDFLFYFHIQESGWGFSLINVFRLLNTSGFPGLVNFLYSNGSLLIYLFIYLFICIQLLRNRFVIEFFYFLPIFLLSVLSLHVEFRWALSSYALYLSFVLFKRLSNIYFALAIMFVTLFNFMLSWTSGLGPM
jgi:Gpi18-like mannosyltransferase